MTTASKTARRTAGNVPWHRAWYHNTYGLPVSVTNCSNNYGPFQFPEKPIPLMLRKALAHSPLPVYGKGDNIRDWLCVEDHARALCAVLEHGTVGASYNIGGDSELPNMAVVEHICALIDELRPEPAFAPRRQLIRFVEDRPGHDFRYAVDTGKITRELGWKPAETFESGLRKTVAWDLENPGWSESVTADSDAGRRLGLAKP